MIDDYLAEFRRALPRLLLRRGRILAEVEEHLRESARERGEDAALAAFGAPRAVARGYAPLAAGQLAAAALLAVLAYPLLSYGVVENALPPAPWPSEEAKPEHLAWKQQAAVGLFLVALGAAAAAVVPILRGRTASLLGVTVALAALGAMAVLGLVLHVQWADAVPRTPGWLVLVPLGQLAAIVVAAGPATRAVMLAARTA